MYEKKIVVALSVLAVTLVTIILVAILVDPAIGAAVGLVLLGIAKIISAIRGNPNTNMETASMRPSTPNPTRTDTSEVTEPPLKPPAS